MKQFWTPLARAFGFRLNTPVEASTPPKPPLGTHFPLLEKALTNYAWQCLMPAAKLKAEIKPEGVLSLQSLHLKSLSHAMDEELVLWRKQGSPLELINWIRHGPFSVPDIQAWISCAELDQLHIDTNPVTPETATPPSAYAFESSDQDGGARSLDIQSEWHWIARTDLPTQPASQGTAYVGNPAAVHHTDAEESSTPHELLVEIVDEQGVRRLRMRHTNALWVLGKPKQMLDPEGRAIQPIHAQAIDFQGQSAQYVATLGRHMSGMHIAVRHLDRQWQWLDLRSTNGSYDSAGRVTFVEDQWQTLEPLNPIYLGGPSSDNRRLSPSVSLLADAAPSWISAHATPLRPSPGNQEFLESRWVIHADDDSPRIPITHLPFTIGRDTRCDAVLSAAHTLVSRQHLVIEAINEVSGQWKIRDVSSQGLTECGSTPPAPLRHGAWLPLDDQVILGRSGRVSGVGIRISPIDHRDS